MKATLEIPDELYRMVKARSALEGRSLRSVAIELFQEWLQRHSDSSPPHADVPPSELREFPWLAISQKYRKPGISHDMDDIRNSVYRARAAEAEAPYPKEKPVA
jgi:hypothetical protein